MDVHTSTIYGSQGIVNGILTEEMRRLILMEFFDCFLASEKGLVDDENLMQEFSVTVLQLSPSQLDVSLRRYHPGIEINSKYFIIGRARRILRNLYLNSEDKHLLEKNPQGIIYNAYSSRLLE